MRASLKGLKIQKLSDSFPLAAVLTKSSNETFFLHFLYIHITWIILVVILGEKDLRKTLII